MKFRCTCGETAEARPDTALVCFVCWFPMRPEPARDPFASDEVPRELKGLERLMREVPHGG